MNGRSPGERFAGERVVVVGAGVAGAAAATVLLAEGAEVSVTESASAAQLPNMDALTRAGVPVHAGGHERAHLDGATLVVTGPGVPEAAPILEWARSRDLPVWGEMELGARLCEVPYVAVTGTNGKTTVTGMIASCLRAAGTDAVACGNIGHPFPTAALEGHQALVVECSSFQLRLQESLHPRVSVLLNLAPDHLDWHGSLAAYADAKASIYRNQHGGDVHVGNRDDPAARAVSERAPCAVVWTTTNEPRNGEVGIAEGVLVARVSGEQRVAPIRSERTGHLANAAAAAAASLAFGVPVDAVRDGIASFTPMPHRGEIVATVSGVRFIDNSKATNVHAAVEAIREAGPDAVLIAGGRAKGVDLSPLRAEAVHLSAAIVIGEAARQLVDVFDAAVPVTEAPSLEVAVGLAFEAARHSAGVVLLAPACASWDQFTDYGERGERFAAAARSLDEVSADGRA